MKKKIHQPIEEFRKVGTVFLAKKKIESWHDFSCKEKD
jgi:hypothetical protein